MRLVPGRTDHVVVVGAGLAGLSATLRLLGAGRRVTVLEAGPDVGGRCGSLSVGGRTFDTGPTVLTMPGLIEDALACVGESLADRLSLTPVAPAYRTHHADGSTLDVHADPEAMADHVAAVCGPREADGYRRYVTFVSQLYRHEMRSFIDRNVDSPLDLVRGDARRDLVRLAALGGFRKLAPVVGRYLRDERLRRVFSFQAMYAGLSPYDALAIYAVIAYMDSVAGVFFPRGGMHAVPRALAAAASAHGAEIRCGTSASRLRVQGGRAVAAVLDDGSEVAADAFVLTPDLPVAYRELLGVTPRRVARQTYSPSCFLLLGASATPGAHHEITFGRSWRETFAELGRGSLMSDPSYLVTRPGTTDPSFGDAAYVLFPTPNARAPIDWSVVGPRYADEVVSVLARDGVRVEPLDVTTPADWAARGLEAGAPFAAAHSFRQTGPFRAANLCRSVEGVVFAGSGTTPGVGVPMVLVSGRLAAERITGPDPAYRSRTWL